MSLGSVFSSVRIVPRAFPAPERTNAACKRRGA
jgi:hypothetical protein